MNPEISIRPPIAPPIRNAPVTIAITPKTSRCQPFSSCFKPVFCGLMGFALGTALAADCAAPHVPQNLSVGVTSLPQDEQYILSPSLMLVIDCRAIGFVC